MRTALLAFSVLVGISASGWHQDDRQRQGAPPAQQRPPQARPARTEDEARQVAARNRAEREKQRQTTGAPVELVPSYARVAIGTVPESLGVSPFYKKYVDALGIPVISSERAPDDALLVARDIVNSMLAFRPDVRKALLARKAGIVRPTRQTRRAGARPPALRPRAGDGLHQHP
jgi:hypothetical protein